MFKATILGSGAAWPDAHRNPPSHAVKIDDDTLLFDCGGGTVSRLMQGGFKPSEMRYLFLSHLHIDHCVEYSSLIFGSYLTGKKDEWNVFGPKGTQAFSDSIFNNVYPFARQMARSLRNVEIQINITEVPSGNQPVEVINTGKWKVSAVGVKHGIDTLAYRVDVHGSSIVISGDTEPCPSLLQIARKATLLIQDCAWPDEMGERPGHCIPRQVREIVKTAEVSEVILVHMFPPCNGHEEEMVKSVKEGYGGDVVAGEDLLTITVS